MTLVLLGSDTAAALPQKLEFSAEGAKYESQGQALSRAKRVAPGLKPYDDEALKERDN